MSKITRRFVLFLLPLTVFTLCTCSLASEWKASLLPASLNPDNTIRLAGGETQSISLALQADKEVTASAATHNIVLEWDLPFGMSIAGNGGVYKFADPTVQEHNGRTLVSFKVQVPNGQILGTPGSRIASEWQNQSIFVSAPTEIPAAQSYLKLTLTEGTYSKTFDWPIKVLSQVPPAQRPKHTPIGFWDYGYSYTSTPVAAAGVAKLFHDSGVTFTESAGNEIYRKALQSQGIITGGYTGAWSFADPKYEDYNPAGKAAVGGYPNAQSIMNLPEGTPIPGVKDMVTAAKTGDGMAIFDFEPHGNIGFGPAAVAAFQKEYNISDADFQTFRDYVAKNSLKTFQSTDPLIAKTWRQWTQFRTAQAAGYVQRIAQDFKSQLPNGRIAITASDKYGADNLGTLAFGCDNAAMAKYADIMLPQIYCGYNGAAAKMAMQTTQGWRDEIQQQKAKTQLWPLLLVRYAGAGFGNSPQNLHQQAIGCLAHGANGVMFYYPTMMDAPYWEMLARLNEDIAKYEDFYQNGKRVDDKFPVSNMPQSSVKIDVYPNYQETVQNPAWSFTAHQLGSKVLLTMINLQDTGDLTFDVNTGKAKVLSTQNTKKTGINKWSVAPGQIGFVVLKGK